MVAIVVAQLGASGPALVQRVLRDWSAVGLLAETIWVDCDQTGGSVMGIYVHGAHAESIDVTRWIPENPSRSYTACVLDVWGWHGEAGMADPATVHERVKAWLPVDALHVLAVPMDISGLPATAVPAWSDVVVLSCLDSSAPSTPPYSVKSTDPDFITHTATGLASVACLWSWCEGVSRPAHISNDLSKARVVRSFVRVIDSRPLLQGILADIDRSVADGLPVAIDDTGKQKLELPQVPTDRLGQRVSPVSKAVLDRNAALARFNPPTIRRGQGQTSIGFWKALKKYFAYLWEAIKSLPGDIARSVAGRVERSVVGFGQRLEGQDSKYKVVLNDDRAKRANQLGAALAESSQEILRDADPNWSPPPPQAELLWSDVFQVACGLIDGEVPGSPELAKAMPREGDSPMVVTRPSAIAPDPDGPPFTVDDDEWTLDLSPHDPLVARMVQKALSEALSAEQDVAKKSRLETLYSRFTQWVARQRSFAWDVGWGIASSLVEAVDYQARLLNGMDQNQRDEWVKRLEESIRTLKKKSIIILVLTVLGFVALGFLAGFSDLSVWVLAGIGIGWLVTMVVIAVVACTKQITIRYRAENELREDPWDRASRARQDLNDVAHEVTRLAGIADQVSWWVALMGELAHHTRGFGSHGDVQDGDGTILVGKLPLSMQVAQVRYQPDVDGEIGRIHMALAYSAKAELFSVGWFRRLAEARIRKAGRQWCAKRGLSEDATLKQILADSRQAPDGPLSAVMREITNEQNRSQSTLLDQLRQWARHGGRTQWQTALQGAQLVAGIGTAFDSGSFFSDLRQDRLDSFRADFSKLGQGRGSHGKVEDLFAPVSVGLADSPVHGSGTEMDGLVQALCRVLASPSVNPEEELRCCEDDSSSDEAEPSDDIVVPRFGREEEDDA